MWESPFLRRLCLEGLDSVLLLTPQQQSAPTEEHRVNLLLGHPRHATQGERTLAAQSPGATSSLRETEQASFATVLSGGTELSGALAIGFPASVPISKIRFPLPERWCAFMPGIPLVRAQHDEGR
jgi:hypothetical protein